MSLADKLSKETPQSNAARREALGKIAQLLDRNGIDIDEVGRVQRVSLYQSLIKNDEGEAEVVDLAAIQLSPAWEEGPRWELPNRGKAIKLPPRKARPAKTTEWKTAVILPDMQIGYFRLADDSLEPTHDEQAMALALEMTRAADPDVIVMHGDNLDLPEQGRYVVTPAYSRTTQATIDRATLLCAQLRDAAPNAKIIWLAGNHEERLPRYIMQNASAAFGLRRGNEPQGMPVMSVPFLCRMDEYNVEYRPGYPASNYWVNDRMRIIHGDKVNSSGSTATKYLAREKVSVLYGHIHRREWAEMTREDHDGARTVLAASAGCLARVDGAVPSVKGGTDLDGRPIVRHEDWQQGIAVVDYQDGDAPFHLELVPIREGHARWRGVDYHATDVGVG